MAKAYAPMAIKAAIPKCKSPVKPVTMFKPSAKMANTITPRMGSTMSKCQR